MIATPKTAHESALRAAKQRIAYTYHGRNRCEQRSIPQEAVIETVNHPDYLEADWHDSDCMRYHRGDLVVVLNTKRKLVTAFEE